MIDINDSRVQRLAERAYARARRQAFWRKVRSLLGEKCNDLIPARQLFDTIPNYEQQHLGLQEVALDRIVGSSGRYRDFDRAFLPLREESDGRWLNIARAKNQGVALPPPLLYQIGDAYFVEDGNHRISVARANGHETIQAQVIAVDSSDLLIEPSCTRLGFKLANAAYSH